MAEMDEPAVCPEVDYNSYCVEPDVACNEYLMQQTMFRIKDPKVSLEFYTKVLGMRWVDYTTANVDHVCVVGC